MFNKKLMRVVLTISTIFFSSSLFASGGYSGDSGHYGSSTSEKKVDQAYENGKSIYKGRITGKKVSYCIADGSSSVAVKRSSIRQLKGGKYADVGERLHNCANPEEKMKALLTEYQLNSVAYYLNKRYRLNLARS